MVDSQSNNTLENGEVLSAVGLAIALAIYAPGDHLDMVIFARQTDGTACSSEASVSSSSAGDSAIGVVDLIDQWLADTSDYDREAWPEIAENIDRNRSSERKLFR